MGGGMDRPEAGTIRGVEPLLILREGLLETVARAEASGLFAPPSGDAPPVLPREAKEALWGLWERVLDTTLALDRIAAQHARWARRWGRARRGAQFVRCHAAFLAAYRGALAFIALAERDPRFDAVLNDAVPEFGLPAGTYDAYKLRFLHVARGAEFALLRAVAPALASGRDNLLWAASEEDAAALWAEGIGRGSALTARNALSVLRKEGSQAWFPVQRGASLVLSHLRLPVRRGWLIRRRQLRALLALLEPGDVLLQRREWVFTNVGLPGFWTHAALFVGTPAERGALAADPGVREWLGERRSGPRDLEAHLVVPPGAAAPSRGFAPGRVLEALAPGVVLNSLEHSAACDGLAVLRPRLPAFEKAAALVRAFHFLGRPYDFAFDYATDSALVCSEVIAKSYDAREGTRGLRLPLGEIAGHAVVPPNDIARLFDEESGRDDRQFDLVCFLDGREWEGRALPSDPEEFRKSWRRPKWHVFAQGLHGARGTPAPAN